MQVNYCCYARRAVYVIFVQIYRRSALKDTATRWRRSVDHVLIQGDELLKTEGK